MCSTGTGGSLLPQLQRQHAFLLQPMTRQERVDDIPEPHHGAKGGREGLSVPHRSDRYRPLGCTCGAAWCMRNVDDEDEIRYVRLPSLPSLILDDTFHIEVNSWSSAPSLEFGRQPFALKRKPSRLEVQSGENRTTFCLAVECLCPEQVEIWCRYDHSIER